MQRRRIVAAILIFLAGIISGGWLPLPIALLISTITGGSSGYLLAQVIIRGQNEV